MGEEHGAQEALNRLSSLTHVRVETEAERAERIEREVREAFPFREEEVVGETEAERIAREEREEEEMERWARTMQQSSKNVVYPDYQMKEDFSLWLQGFGRR